MTSALELLLANSQATLREFGMIFARMIAGLAVDPHGDFEKKYCARIENAHSDGEISGVLAQLVQWSVSSAISDEQRQRLNQELQGKGLPSIAELRAHLLP
jgi:hypothetical protein